MIGRLRRFLTVILGRRRFEREMADELADHLARRADDLAREGLPRAEAERRARLELGGVEGWKESCREARRLDLIDELGRNLRHAGRILARAPGLTAAVIFTLGLGIGANVAVFALVDAVLLRPLPYPDPDRLALVETRWVRDDEVVDRTSSQDGRTWETLAEGVEQLDLAVFREWPAGVNVVYAT